MFWNIIAALMAIVGASYFLPQVIRAFKRGNSKGLSIWFLLFWALDKTLSLVYTTHIEDNALIFKYSVGVMCVGYLLYLKIFIKD